MNDKWLGWIQRLNAIAQNGLHYTRDQYDRDRYEQIIALADEIAQHHTGAEVPQLRNIFAHETPYITPKVDVRGVVFYEGKILLVQEASDQQWTLPGGWADVGDTPSKATEREVLEESGYQTKAVKLLAVFDKSQHEHPPQAYYVYKLFIRCDLLGGTAQTSYETSGVDWFALDSLPPLSLDRVTEKQIQRMFEHYANPDVPTDFD